jgi:hypothetical protein
MTLAAYPLFSSASLDLASVRLVLGVESSCDETGVALVALRGHDVPVLLSHALYSQIEMHQAYGGVCLNSPAGTIFAVCCRSLPR